MNRDNKHLCETETSDKEELPSSNHEKATCYNLKLISQSAKMVLVLSRVGHQHLNSNNGWFMLCFTAFLIFFFFSSKTGYSSKTHSFNLQFRDGLASSSYRRSLQMSTTPSGFNLSLDIGHGWSNWHLPRGIQPLSFKRSPCRG